MIIVVAGIVSLALAVSAQRLNAQTVSDSAGVRVVRYTRAAVPARHWSIDSKPLLEIGGVDGQGPSEFAEIRGVVRLQDGRIAVANGSTNEVRIFSPGGAFQTSGGRAGSGPGEFRRLLRLFRFGDTLAGVDADTRMRMFTADGRLVRSLNPTRPEGHRSPQVVGILRDGSSVVVATRNTPQTAAHEVLHQYSVFRGALGGESPTSILELPGYREVRVGQAPSRLLLDGEGTVTARDVRVCAGFSGRFDLTCYDPSGVGITRIVRETEVGAPTDADRNVVRNAYLAAKWVSEFDPSTNLPGPPALLAPTRSRRWNIFSSDGRWLADILLPARFVAHDVGGDYVAGVSFDADGVERVTVWRLRR